MIEPALAERARRIKVLLFDVDGVLTDGSITIIPGPDGTALRSRVFPRMTAWESRWRMLPG